MNHTRLDRRKLLTTICHCGVALGSGLLAGSLVHAAGKSAKTTLTPDQALAALKAGNDAFVRDAPFHAALGHHRRTEIAGGQSPIAVLVGCSDSRVPPELLFGRGLGELFIVRNAGNTIDNTAEGSIEYGVEELGAPLIVVLGHERCGAVQAAVALVENDATFPGNIGRIVEPIVPAVLKARHVLEQGGRAKDRPALVEASVRENVRRVVHWLRNSEPLLMEAVHAGRLKIVGARYDLDEGRVEFLPD
jgi:carbonic anhydrase